MPGSAIQRSTMRQLLEGQQQDLGRLQQGSTARQRRIIREAFLQVKAEVAALPVSGLTWSAADRLAVHQMVGRAYRQIYTEGQGAFSDGVEKTVTVAQANAATYLATLDNRYVGVVRALRFDTLAWWENTNKTIGATRLRQYQQSFARYGGKAVTAVEDAVAKATITGKKWTDMRTDVWKAVRHEVNDRQWMVDRIIRTELSAAYNGTTLAALQEEGGDPTDPMKKRLVTTFDNRTGKDSKLLHGQTRKVKEPFFDSMRGIHYQAPPNRPHDREVVVGWRDSYGEALGDPFDDKKQYEVIKPPRPPDLVNKPPTRLKAPISPALGIMTLAQAAQALGLRGSHLKRAIQDEKIVSSTKVPPGKTKAVETVTAEDLEAFRLQYLHEKYGFKAPTPTE